MNTIVVLGMHRSGSSIVSGILHELGIDMGRDAFGKTAYNPTGHFEDENVVSLNNHILDEAGGSWKNPPEKSIITRVASNYSDRMIEICQKGSALKGYKDPRMCLTIHCWYPHLISPKFIVCEREPEEIVKSLRVRNGLEREEAMDLIKRYTDDINVFFQSNKGLDCLLVRYADLCSQPIQEISKMVQYIQLAPSASAIKKAASLIVPRDSIRKQRISHMINKAIRKPYKILPFIRERYQIWRGQNHK